MQLLVEAIAFFYPMKTIMEESLNGNDDEIITVYHDDGEQRSKGIMNYVMLNNPNPEKARKKSLHTNCLSEL
jgi:hypothetical protein